MRHGNYRTLRHDVTIVVMYRLISVFITPFAASQAPQSVGANSPPASHPNVNIVMTNDQGYGEFSCHGNPIALTPNVDRLASEAFG